MLSDRNVLLSTLFPQKEAEPNTLIDKKGVYAKMDYVRLKARQLLRNKQLRLKLQFALISWAMTRIAYSFLDYYSNY